MHSLGTCERIKTNFHIVVGIQSARYVDPRFLFSASYRPFWKVLNFVRVKSTIKKALEIDQGLKWLMYIKSYRNLKWKLRKDISQGEKSKQLQTGFKELTKVGKTGDLHTKVLSVLVFWFKQYIKAYMNMWPIWLIQTRFFKLDESIQHNPIPVLPVRNDAILQFSFPNTRSSYLLTI